MQAPTRARPDLSRRQATWAIAGVCAIALGFRVWALSYGLPDVLNPDEIPILNRALAFGKGSLNPHNFLYPTLYFYALFAWEALFLVFGRLAGLFHSLGDFERQFFLDPSRHVLAGRALTAMFGMATVVATYRFGARLYDRATGVVAALLLAAAPLAVRDAHYIKQDVPVTFFIVLTQLAAVRLVLDEEDGDRRWRWLVAGGMAGLALSTHYYAFPVITPIVVAALLHAQRTGAWGRSFRLLVWAGVASIAAFVATTPFLVFELPTAIRDMVAVRQLDIDRTPGAWEALRVYGARVAVDVIGWTVPPLAVLGALWSVVQDKRRAAMLLAFPLAFLLFLSHTLPMTRYANAMVPSIALAAAFALRRLTRDRTLPLALAAAVVAISPIADSVRTDRFLAAADTRTLAREFLERTAPAGAGVLVQPHGVQLRTSREALVEALRRNLGDESAASVKFQKQLDAAAHLPHPFRVLYLGDVTDGGRDPDKIYVSPKAISPAAGLAALRGQRVTYVAVERYNSAFEPLYEALLKEARLIESFSPDRERPSADGPPRVAGSPAVPPFFHNTADRIDPRLERPGPTIDIWRID